MPESRHSRIRFSVNPRDIPAQKAARRLHLTEEEFEAVKDELFARNFPRPDPTTGMYDLDAIDGLDGQIRELVGTLLDQAELHAGAVMPGYTHLQPAQPVTFGHHLMAYVEMLGRDRGRLGDCRRRLNECPLGAAAPMPGLQIGSRNIDASSGERTAGAAS